MLRPEQLQIYTRVAELASFTQAADSLGLPKASVSQAVQQLESSLGTRLLHRTTRRVQTTQDGQVFYERCKDLLAQLDEAQSLFRTGGEAVRGRLRVDMPSGVARQQVLPRLGEFLALHPELELELSSTDRRVDLVREGFDCVLRIGALEDSALVARPLGYMAQINCASPAYLARHGTPQTLEDLAKHRLVHYLPTLGARPLGWEYVEQGAVRTVPMAGALTVNDTAAYSAACVAGLGLIQAPAMGMRPLIEQGLLVEVLPRWRAPAMPVSLVYANSRQLPRRAQLFMNWLAELLRDKLERVPADPAPSPLG